MFSGVKFISRDELDNARDVNDLGTNEPKRNSKKSKPRKKCKSHVKNDSSDENVSKIGKRSKRGRKWSYSDDDSSESDVSERNCETKNRKDPIRKRERHTASKVKTAGKIHRSENSQNSLCSDEDDDAIRRDTSSCGSKPTDDIDIVRREMGLDWMLKPASVTTTAPEAAASLSPEKTTDLEVQKTNPRELNPYLLNNGSGYPEDDDGKTDGCNKLRSSCLVGDGGASWRMKALKRAKEQAAREGRKIDEVVEERWGSLGQLAETVSRSVAAPARAHLHAIKNRKKGVESENRASISHEDDQGTIQRSDQNCMKGASPLQLEMKTPKAYKSLSWGKKKDKALSAVDSSLIATAAASLNKFEDDGSFMSSFLKRQSLDSAATSSSSAVMEEKIDSFRNVKNNLSANQLAAKALQLRMKGNIEEADKLTQEIESVKANQSYETPPCREQIMGRRIRSATREVSARKMEEDADRKLAQNIMKNRTFNLSSRAEDEYDYELAPKKKFIKKNAAKEYDRNDNVRRFVTQQEQCIFCFENPSRPKHLVLSIANLTYLMLPQWQPVAPGHCCILPLQHESSTRTVDNNVWEEIRNFKKCLIMMFSQQEKEVVFLETVIGLAKQRRHCLIECIPLPSEVAKQAPLYFKKAIDEAEDEWSQHNSKKLIDTSEKGLRGSIPKDFPYFHVEFGLKKGFVHVIDDENNFNSNLGLNVIRGMLRTPEEDMYRRRRYESVDAQKQAAANFMRDWQPFDWTHQLT